MASVDYSTYFNSLRVKRPTKTVSEPSNEVKATKDPKTSKTCKEANTVAASFCNCPVCNERMRIDTIHRHCVRKHKKELIDSMPIALRQTIAEKKTPIVFGFQGNDKVVMGCMCCEKGLTEFSNRAYEMTGPLGGHFANHSECSKSFGEYASWYESKDEPVSLPHKMKRTENPKTAKGGSELPTSAPNPPSVDADLLEMVRKAYEPAEDEEEITLQEMIEGIVIRYNRNHAVLEGKNRTILALKEQVGDLKTRNAELESEVGDLKTNEERLKAEVAELEQITRGLYDRLEAPAGDQGSEGAPTGDQGSEGSEGAPAEADDSAEILADLEALQSEYDKLKEAYNKLYTEATAREEELEEELRALRANGHVCASTIEPLRKVFYLDADNSDVTNPTVNELVHGVVGLAKEALLTVEKDQVLLKRYSKRIEQLETLLAGT
jgi:FtsZ-binding cell division protein ZapB